MTLYHVENVVVNDVLLCCGVLRSNVIFLVCGTVDAEAVDFDMRACLMRNGGLCVRGECSGARHTVQRDISGARSRNDIVHGDVFYVSQRQTMAANQRQQQLVLSGGVCIREGSGCNARTARRRHCCRVQTGGIDLNMILAVTRKFDMCQRNLMERSSIITGVNIDNAIAMRLVGRGNDHEDATGIRAAVADQVKAVAVEAGGQRGGNIRLIKTIRLPDTGFNGLVHNIRSVKAEDVEIRVLVRANDHLSLLRRSRHTGCARRPLNFVVCRHIWRQEILLIENVRGGDDADGDCLGESCRTSVHDLEVCGRDRVVAERCGSGIDDLVACRIVAERAMLGVIISGTVKRNAIGIDALNCAQIVIDQVFQRNAERQTEVEDILLCELGIVDDIMERQRLAIRRDIRTVVFVEAALVLRCNVRDSGDILVEGLIDAGGVHNIRIIGEIIRSTGVCVAPLAISGDGERGAAVAQAVVVCGFISASIVSHGDL